MRIVRLALCTSIVLAHVSTTTPAAAAASRQEADAIAPLLAELEWRNIGPAISSGRVVDIAVPQGDPDVVYAASAAGGLWKSSNRGTTWTPVFDREGSVSIGAIAIAPTNASVVWVGTGEANNQRSSSWGDGVYRSDDGGGTWRHMGLRASQHVGGLAIHPDDENIVYVAALGPLWGAGTERGLFRTRDGGETWENVLSLSDHTGVVDVVLDPRDPDRIYAAAYQRERRNWSFVGGGPESGIYRSEDGGDSWTKLDNGLPDPDIGKIGFAISPSDPDVVYAIIEAQDRQQTGVYVTHDRGASWEHRSTTNPTPWYYSQIRVDPQDSDRVYVLGTRLAVSDDGGRTFRNDGAPRIHVDHHALWIDPHDGSHMIIGNDGGLAFTWDRGTHWDFVDNLPITQFYHLGVDLREPFYYVCGGTQDNNTWCGPSGTRNSDGIVNDDWYITVGGDGFYAQADPRDPDIVYSESQYGNLVRFNARTGERKRIRPQPPEGERYRWNWSAPIVISPHDPDTIYFAANRVFRSTDQGDAWEVISDDLSRQLDRDELPLMGRNWPRDAVSRHAGVSEYGNITTLDESPVRQGLLAAGTDDGLINISLDGGDNWTRVDSFPGVPEMTRVSRLMWSFHDEGRIYVAFDGHKDNDFRPYLFRSDDHGASWTPITADLPEFGSTRVIREHPRNPELLAAGTEFGVFVSVDAGGSWIPLRNNLPTVAVHDLIFHPRDNDLVIATHGRGFWILDDIAILEELAAGLATGSHLATVRPALQFNEFNRGRGSQGASYYRAPNPPRGAILTYLVGAGDDAQESAAAAVRLEILDADGGTVRRLEARSASGVHRAIWDLRHEPPYRPSSEQAGFGPFGGRVRGPLVLPGEYTARLSVGDRTHEQRVRVLPDPLIDLPDADRRARHETLRELSALQGTLHAATSTIDDLQELLGTVRGAVDETATAPDALRERLTALTGEVRRIGTELRGARRFPPDPDVPPGVSQVVNQLVAAISGFTGAPTAAEMEALERARQRLGSAVEALNEVQSVGLPALNEALDAAGIPWTPGRAIHR